LIEFKEKYLRIEGIGNLREIASVIGVQKFEERVFERIENCRAEVFRTGLKMLSRKWNRISGANRIVLNAELVGGSRKKLLSQLIPTELNFQRLHAVNKFGVVSWLWHRKS
jgi:hypothetical protein